MVWVQEAELRRREGGGRCRGGGGGPGGPINQYICYLFYGRFVFFQVYALSLFNRVFFIIIVTQFFLYLS